MGKSMFRCPDCSESLVFEVSMKNLFGAVEKRMDDDTLFMRFAGLYMNNAEPEISRIVCRNCIKEIDLENVDIICPFTGEQYNQSEFVLVNAVRMVDDMVAKQKRFLISKHAETDLKRLERDYTNHGYTFEVSECSIQVEEGLLNA